VEQSKIRQIVSWVLPAVAGGGLIYIVAFRQGL